MSRQARNGEHHDANKLKDGSRAVHQLFAITQQVVCRQMYDIVLLATSTSCGPVSHRGSAKASLRLTEYLTFTDERNM